MNSTISAARSVVRSWVVGVSIALMFGMVSTQVHGDEGSVTKIFTVDVDSNDVYAEITNTGTINAANRLYESAAVPLDAKTHALDAVFTGAASSGKLVRTSLVPGDQFFAIDAATGQVVVVTFTATDSFVIPGGTASFGKWTIPGGVR